MGKPYEIVMPTITIHTATFNRSHLLTKAYESLKAQTCKDFEWIITDDGSTDDTEKLVRDWQKKNSGFNIIYTKLPHVGFPRALNYGVRKASSSWFMMLDSDDYLLPETVETVMPWLKEIECISNIAGIGVTRCHPDGSFMKEQQPIIDPQIGFVDASNSDRTHYHLDMDCFEVNRTSLLREYPFQYWPTEEYAPPALNYNAMSIDGYIWRWRIAKLYISEYLPDGLTRSSKKVKNNPMGYAMMYNQNLLRSPDFKSRCYNAIQMTALCMAGGHPWYLLKTNAPLASLLTLPIGIIWGLRRKYQFSRID